MKTALLYLWIILLLSTCSQVCKGHHPKETHATIMLQADYLMFQLEAPWSLRTAVFHEFPLLEEEKDRSVIETHFKTYLLHNISIKNGEKNLAPIDIQIQEGSHSHSLKAMIKYRLATSNFEQITIKNTLLFNIYPDQKNHHQLIFSNQSTKRYLTTVTAPQFSVSDQPAKRHPYLTWKLVSAIFLLAIVVGCSIVQLRLRIGR